MSVCYTDRQKSFRLIILREKFAVINITTDEMTKSNYRDWVAYFEENDACRLDIDFSEDIALTEEEAKLIFPSIRAFQRGEGSDGRHLLRSVDVFVQKTGERDYRRAMELFIKEENFHSAYLKKYMDHYRIPSLKQSFLDRVFRRLRQFGGLRGEVTVLVTAEMIALSYYSALAECTRSPVLKRICEQMLHDELPHIIFQSYTLSHFKNGFARRAVRRIIMDVTTLFVWCAFRRVFRTGGYGLRRFMNENRGYLRQSNNIAKNKSEGL